MKPFCDTAGSRTPQRGKTSQKLATLRAVSACVVTTWRGKSIHNLFNEKKSWRVGSRTPQHSREPQPVLAILHGVSRRMQKTLLSIINEVKHLGKGARRLSYQTNAYL